MDKAMAKITKPVFNCKTPFILVNFRQLRIVIVKLS
ncbi:hypothetical protein SDC9_206936 [bioreactor metagenome]|uniref:Uncharacterized protein n=1 Tax=bioreactor metagenome TaxID=1076179 RepID=A0A645J660_9ZZZZ